MMGSASRGVSVVLVWRGSGGWSTIRVMLPDCGCCSLLASLPRSGASGATPMPSALVARSVSRLLGQFKAALWLAVALAAFTHRCSRDLANKRLRQVTDLRVIRDE